MGGNPYLDDLAASLPSDRIEEVSATWNDLSERDARSDVDVLHIQLLQMVLESMRSADPPRAIARYARRLARLRRNGVAVVWTMHNLASHEAASPLVDRAARRLTAMAAARVVVHCGVAQRHLRRLWPRARSVVMPHPAHDAEPLARGTARDALGLSAGARVIAIPGRVRAYKDVAGAVRALRAAAGDDTVIIVAGAPHTDALGEEVRAAAGGDPRVRLDLRLVDDEELHRVVAASDVVMLPYRRILTSGTAVLAGEEGVPCVAPAIGCLTEQLGEGGLTYPPGDLATAARLALTTPLDELRSRGADTRRRITATTWARAGAVHASIYEAAAQR